MGNMLETSEGSKGCQYTCEQIEARTRDVTGTLTARQVQPLLSNYDSQLEESADEQLTVQPQLINGTGDSRRREESNQQLTAPHSNEGQIKELQEAVQQTQKQLLLITEKLDTMSQQQSIASSPQHWAGTVRPAVEVAVREEVKRAVTKSVSEIAGKAVVTQLNSELDKLLGQMEKKIMTSVSMMVSSKQFSDNLGGVISNAVIPGVKDSCSDSYANIILPGFQGLTKSILQQLNDLYQKGTADYLMQVRKEVNNFMLCLENTKTCAIGEIEASKNAVGAVLKSHQELLTQHQAAMQQHSSVMVSEASIKRIVTDEMAKVVTLLQRMPSGNQTPSSAVNYLGAQQDNKQNCDDYLAKSDEVETKF